LERTTYLDDEVDEWWRESELKGGWLVTIHDGVDGV
jgi:hypothetical protein